MRSRQILDDFQCPSPHTRTHREHRSRHPAHHQLAAPPTSTAAFALRPALVLLSTPPTSIAMLRTSVARASAASRQAVRAPLQQTRQAHAISNPTLANIEKRWEAMPPQEQADLWMALRDRMKTDWKELTMQEKKAAYWIAFGPHGPRSLPPPNEGRTIFLYTMAGVAATAVIFGTTRMFARKETPKTMTKEYQEASEEYLKSQGSEPITGYKGMLVQSKPAGKSADS
ncbi:COX4-domain-containing protein [Saccharata proteae CBS 121410]|uniref:Cytochrome c oxidase polypeptide V n=1 Tax=Saccharata proteae CBS 121410 TaxID=1314787 RepID=A0A9P4HQ38_9PEZI|nr:COX4-domain-containing protein [Saccharata proteae CBS 121410]